MTINVPVRKLVRARAEYMCEYCHSLEKVSAALFTTDDIIPQSFPRFRSNHRF